MSKDKSNAPVVLKIKDLQPGFLRTFGCCNERQ